MDRSRNVWKKKCPGVVFLYLKLSMMNFSFFKNINACYGIAISFLNKKSFTNLQSRHLIKSINKSFLLPTLLSYVWKHVI